MFQFHIIPGETVRNVLQQNRAQVLDIVRAAYTAHCAGKSVNPGSCFLRFPDKPDSRVIALPAFLGGDVPAVGVKWISSFPANVRAGMPRASAVLILNDYETGHPIACLEAAGISAARTAGLAALAAGALWPGGCQGTRTAIIGAGVIARNICLYLHEAGCAPDSYLVHDVHNESGQALAVYLRSEMGRSSVFTADLGAALGADTVVFATTALTPYVNRPFNPGQVVLHISLRDLTPEVIVKADNILDDVDHCLQADTSPHLAEKMTGSREFVTGTLGEVLTGQVTISGASPVIFSPFGLGVLDVALGGFVYGMARQAGALVEVPNFFAETRRW
jgi:N-[(2S)-2-amino-2-carboxyethyl]-L-glutamate dehydrogenase